MTTSPSSVVVSGGFSVEVPREVVASSNPGSPSENGLKVGCFPVSRPLPKFLQVELAFGVGSELGPDFGWLELGLELEVEYELGVGANPGPKFSFIELELELGVGSESCDTEPFPPAPRICASDWTEAWVEEDGRAGEAGFSLDSFPEPGRRVALAGLAAAAEAGFLGDTMVEEA